MWLFWKKQFAKLFSNRGEVPVGDPPKGTPLEKPIATQEEFDAKIKERIGRERAKYADYDNLKKFHAEHQANADAQAQKDLENAKNYEKAKEGYEAKIKEFSGIITQKDQVISGMKIDHALLNEITKQGAYAEESLALLRGRAVMNQDGSVIIKGKDANGIDADFNVEQGIKSFLAARPHLVKAAAGGGGGTGAGGAGGSGAGGGGDDLDSLNQQLMQATKARDGKKINELKVKIGAAIALKRAGG